MPRPKEFDADEVLDRAMGLFWERGYEATSLSDLVEHLGVSKQSLYDTFGDKHAIYTAALERCREREGAPLVEHALASAEPLRRTLRRMFDKVIQQDCAGKSARGCMLVNAAVERGAHDAKVRKLVGDNAQAVEEALVKRLQKAKAEGEIGAHHDPVALARFLASTFSGLRVQAMVVRDRSVLTDVVDVALSVLG